MFESHDSYTLVYSYDLDNQQVMDWGRDGLRTLVFGYREVPTVEFKDWYDLYRTAMSNIEEKVKHDNHKCVGTSFCF